MKKVQKLLINIYRDKNNYIVLPKYKMFFWSEMLQRHKFTYNNKFKDNYKYEFIGFLTEVERQLFLECLFVKHIENSDSDYITLEDVILMYEKYKEFKNYIDNQIQKIND